MTLEEFFDGETEKVVAVCEKYGARDENGKVHCSECPYGYNFNYHCECLFARYLAERGDLS